ncbi:ribonuclease H-like domain-containing protein [Tanacetum coccineum]
MALPEDHLAKFHKITDAKEMWEAIKSRFYGNNESKKMQKYILKQQFEGFSVSNSEGMHKGYDRSLPSAWSQISLIMRTKPGVDSLSFDDLYNNLRVFEPDVKGSTASSSSTQNVAFVSKNTSSTNEVSTAYGRKLQFDAKELVGFDKAKVECYNCHKTWHFARECRSKVNQDSRRRDAGYTGYKAKDSGRRPGKQEEPKALVTLDGEGVDWTSHSEDEQENYALMDYSNSGLDTEAYTQALKKVEAHLVAHQQNQLYYEEKIRFMKIDLDDKTDVLTYHKKLLTEAEKEKEELKAKVEKWQNSFKNLNILLTSQMSVRDKAGLGYGNQMNKGVLSYENEVFESMFYNRSSDIEDSLVNDRYAEGMHAVPPPMTGIYIPSGPHVEIDESQFTYGPKQSKPSESDARSSDFNSCESNSSEEILKSILEPVVNEPKVVSQPKVWSDAPIIEEYESDSDDEHVSLPTKEQETPSFAFVNIVKHDDPHKALKNKGIIDSGCSRHMTGNKAYPVDYQDYNDGPLLLEVVKVSSLVKMYDKKNKVLFTDTECLVLSPDFKLPDV